MSDRKPDRDTDLVTFPARISVGKFVDLPGGILLRILVLNVLIGEVLHAAGVYLIQGPPSLLRRLNVRGCLDSSLEPRGPNSQPDNVLAVEEI